MNYHIQNPWTRSPQVFVHLTVEEAQQLREAMQHVMDTPVSDDMSANARDAFIQTLLHLQSALELPLPRGIKGVMP